jgi:MFS family permease
MRVRLFSRALVTVSIALLFGAMIPNIFVIAPRFLGAGGAAKAEIGMIMGAYQVATLAITPFVVPLAARIGFARVLSLGCAVAGSGALWFAYADALPWFVAARVLQGLGFAAIMVGAAAFVAETAPPSRLGEAMGITAIVTLIAQALGPVLAEFVQQHGSYHAAFLTGAIVGGAGAIAALAMPSSTVRIERARAELQRARPALFALMLSGLGFGAAWLFLADFARSRGVYSIDSFFWPYVGAALFSRIALGKLSDRLGRHRTAAPALLGHMLAFAALPLVHRSWHLFPIGLVYGFVHGTYYPTLQALVVERNVGPRSKAAAASTFAFGVGILAAAFFLGPLAGLAGYNVMYATAAAAAGLAALAVMFDARTP